MVDKVEVDNWEEISLVSVSSNKDAVICLEDVGEWEIVSGSVKSPD